MTGESGRNRQQPEYLNEKDAAEDREGSTPESEDEDKSENAAADRDKQRVIDSAVRNTFRH